MPADKTRVRGERLLFIIILWVDGKPVKFRFSLTMEPARPPPLGKKHPPIWVLNLKQDTNRLRFMRRQLRRLNLPFTVIQAVDGVRLTREELKRYSKERAVQYSIRELSPGEITTSLPCP
jgi:hypothetical protein